MQNVASWITNIPKHSTHDARILILLTADVIITICYNLQDSPSEGQGVIAIMNKKGDKRVYSIKSFYKKLKKVEKRQL